MRKGQARPRYIPAQSLANHERRGSAARNLIHHRALDPLVGRDKIAAIKRRVCGPDQVSRRRAARALAAAIQHSLRQEGADTGRASRINVSQAGGVAAIRIDIAAGSVYLRSCPSGTQSTSGPPLDFSEIGIILPGLKRMLRASHAIRSGGQPCSPRARRSRRGPARS